MSNRLEGNKAFFSKSNRTIVFFLSVLVIVVTLIVDTSLTKLSDIFASNFMGANLFAYILISVSFGVGQIIFLWFMRQRIKDVRASGHLHHIQEVLYKIVMGIQSGLAAIIALVIIQLVTTSQYSVVMLIASITMSYSLGAGMMLLLAKNFFSWFRTNRDLLMLSYGIAAITIVVHLVFSLSFVDYVLSTLAPGRTAFSGQPFFATGSLKFLLGNIYNATSIIAFVSTWSATALLLHNYSRRLGKMRYWILVSLPLVYFLSQFPTFFLNVFDAVLKADPLFYGTFLILLFSISKPAGGVLFGIAFWDAARRLPQMAAVRDYLVISAYGLVLLFTADQATSLFNPSYPPFGLATVSFVGLSSYLVFNGIFYSAVDTRIRRDIRKFAKEQSKLLESIRSAQSDKEINEKLALIMKYHDRIVKSMPIPHVMDENEARHYLDEVIKEKTSGKQAKDSDKEKTSTT